MPTQVTNYQCPACTGPLHFVGSSGKLECDYCGSKFDVSEIEALYAEKEQKASDAQKAAEEKSAQTASTDTGWDTSGLSGDWGQDAAGMKSYSCPSCGAELICDESTAATSCPYCGNPSVVPGQFTGSLKPDFVLPFKLSKDDAVKALKAHYKGKPFLPRAFTAENHVQEIKGVYVPNLDKFCQDSFKKNIALIQTAPARVSFAFNSAKSHVPYNYRSRKSCAVAVRQKQKRLCLKTRKQRNWLGLAGVVHPRRMRRSLTSLSHPTETINKVRALSL